MTKQSLIDFLGHYGELLADIVEELFYDGLSGNPETEGTNRTSTYVAKVRLQRDIPVLVPIVEYRSCALSALAGTTSPNVSQQGSPSRSTLFSLLPRTLITLVRSMANGLN